MRIFNRSEHPIANTEHPTPKLDIGHSLLAVGYSREASRRTAGSHAFTLTELLVTIGIIAVLASLIMVAVSHSRQMARKSACLSNLHQIGLGLEQYLPENRFVMPHCAMAPEADPPVPGEEGLPSIRTVLESFLEDPLVFCCPADPGKKWYEEQGLSYEWQSAVVNGRRVDPKSFKILNFQAFIMMDYDNFHGDMEDIGAKNYLYLNARALGKLEGP